MANGGTRDFFTWTDDEMKRLLKVTHEVKREKEWLISIAVLQYNS